MRTALWAAGGLLGAGLLALLAVEIVHRLASRLGRRSPLMAELAAKAHRPMQVLVTAYAVRLALGALVTSFPARDEVLHAIVIALVAAGAWLVGTLLLVVEDVALARFRTDVPDNLRQRRLHTQVVMVRRVTVAAVAVLAGGVALMTFPDVRAVGASLLASAGIIGVIAGLAAQSMLSNVFAGLQLTFSDAIRLDDVVVVKGEWGKVEEITLSHVVVRVWDDRRLILPTSYFTTTPFENWTRTSAALLGTVELEVDWDAPVPALRDELRSFLEGTDLWDGRVCVLQVTDALGGAVRLRALVSAADAPTLWDLRCLVREHLVAWIHDRHPTALPRLRAELDSGIATTAPVVESAPFAASAARAGVSDLAGRNPARSGVDGVPRLRGESAAPPEPDGTGRPGRDGAVRGGVPRSRGESAGQPDHDGAAQPDSDGTRVFGGSEEGDARGQDFVGPEDTAGRSRP